MSVRNSSSEFSWRVEESWTVKGKEVEWLRKTLDGSQKSVLDLQAELEKEQANSKKLKEQLELALRLLDSMSGR